MAIDVDAELVDSDGKINANLTDYDIEILHKKINGQENISKQSIKGPFRGSGKGQEPGFEQLMKQRSLMLSEEQSEQMLNAENLEASAPNSDVVVPYIPNKYWKKREYEWIINFRNMDLATAERYLLPFQHLHENGRREAIIHNCTKNIPDPVTGELREIKITAKNMQVTNLTKNGGRFGDIEKMRLIQNSDNGIFIMSNTNYCICRVRSLTFISSVYLVMLL